MGLFSSDPATSQSNTNYQNQSQINPGFSSIWGDIAGTGIGLANAWINNPPQYQGQQVADPGTLTNAYWQGASNIQAPDFSGLLPQMGGLYNAASQQISDPGQINLPSNFNFQPGQVSFNDPFAGGTPSVTAPGGVSGLASSYQVTPQQVAAQQVQAPGAIANISGLMQAYAPQLQQYQMGPAQQVGALPLRDLQMQAAAPVGPEAQVGTGTFIAPGLAGAYMSPYTQQVVNAQLAQAQTQEQQQIEQQRAQAAQAGAFGGARSQIEEANTQIGYQQLASQIQATGLQNAYQQAQQQFNVEQQQQLAAQQFNVQTGLQAALANQQAQQQANVQNLSALLQTQGLGAQTGLQAQLANQQAGLTVGQQNLAALLQTQGLGAQTSMQAQLANQQQGLQAALANQQAQEFGAGQQMQASLANQQTGLQAALANQAAGIQTGLAAQQMGLQGAEFTAGQGLQAGLANQAAMMQALGMQYQGGLQGALQTQQLGMQGQIQGAQMGLESAVQQQQLEQAQRAQNLAAVQQQQGVVQGIANLGTQGLQGQLAAQQGLAAAAQSQQGYQQQVADAAYQTWLQQQMMPFQAVQFEAGIMGQQPVPGQAQWGNQQTTTTQWAPQPSIFSDIAGGVSLGVGTAAKIAGMRRGGLAPASGGHSDAAADRAQVLDILREKGLLKARGGLALALKKKPPERFADGGASDDGMIHLGDNPGYFPPQPAQPAAPAAEPYVFEDPLTGALQTGAQSLADYVTRSAQQAKQGWQQLWQPPPGPAMTADQPGYWDPYARAASDVIRGTMGVAAPVALPVGLIAAPEVTIPALLAGTAASAGTEAAAKAAGVPPGQAALIADIAGLWGGEEGAQAGTAAKRGAPGLVKPTADTLRQGLAYLLTDPDAVTEAATNEMRARGAFTSHNMFTAAAEPANINSMVKWSAAKLVKGIQGLPGGAKSLEGLSNLLAGDFGPAAAAQAKGIYDQAAPIADSATRDVKRRSMADLEARIPAEMRVVSADPSKTIDGRPFSSLDLDAPGMGFLAFQQLGERAANNLNRKAWRQAMLESEAPGGNSAQAAVEATGAEPPTARFWNDALSQPARSRYWYELSGETFNGGHFNLSPEQTVRMIDATAGTSGGLQPGANLKRGIGIMSENMQNEPIMTDLRDPVSARKSLDPTGQAVESHKYKSFGGTMQRVAGLSDYAPLTTNDVQVADMFGIKGNDIGQNPILYEVLSRYFLKLRDLQNSMQAPGMQPWESWQLQAPAWVHQRILKDPTMSYNDYMQEAPKVIAQLAAAGIPTPGGKITEGTLMDPRTPDIMSGTRRQFLGTPVGTVEVASTRTPEAAAAAELNAQLEQMDRSVPWVRNAIDRYEQIQRNALSSLATRSKNTPSLISQLMSSITGRKVDVSRLDPTGYGTFEGQLNPNLRIPMTGRAGNEWIDLDPTERQAFLAILGHHLGQDAMAASHFETVPEVSQPDTYSVFLNRYDGVVNKDGIANFSREIGYPVNVVQHPNGTVIDINVGGMNSRPDIGQIENAANRNFGGDPNVQKIGYLSRKYSSDYIEQSDYRKAINALQRTRKAQMDDLPGGSRRVGAAADLYGLLPRVRQAIQAVAKKRDADFADWTQTYQPNLSKYRAAQPPPGFARGGLAAARSPFTDSLARGLASLAA